MVYYIDEYNLIIKFNKKPNIGFNFIDREKPMFMQDDLKVQVISDNLIYYFVIPKGFKWNGADIPEIFWSFMGSSYNPEYAVPSLLHDFVCKHPEKIGYNKDIADKLLKEGLKREAVIFYRRFIMSLIASIFQCFRPQWGENED